MRCAKCGETVGCTTQSLVLPLALRDQFAAFSAGGETGTTLNIEKEMVVYSCTVFGDYLGKKVSCGKCKSELGLRVATVDENFAYLRDALLLHRSAVSGIVYYITGCTNRYRDSPHERSRVTIVTEENGLMDEASNAGLEATCKDAQGLVFGGKDNAT